MNKLIGLTLLIFTGCALIPGCGSSGHTRKLKSMATKYVKEKYDIKAKAGRVSNDGISWLTPIWEKSKAGIVEMKYDGEKTYVSLMESNKNQDFVSKYYFSRYILAAGETIICRMVTEDK